MRINSNHREIEISYRDLVLRFKLPNALDHIEMSGIAKNDIRAIYEKMFSFLISVQGLQNEKGDALDKEHLLYLEPLDLVEIGNLYFKALQTKNEEEQKKTT